MYEMAVAEDIIEVEAKSRSNKEAPTNATPFEEI
jgi:hypothetical protein